MRILRYKSSTVTQFNDKIVTLGESMFVTKSMASMERDAENKSKTMNNDERKTV